MKTNFRILLAIFEIVLLGPLYSQDTPTTKIHFQETPIEGKYSFTAWRVDYYICTALAYAKSMGHSVEDFAEFVGNRHGLGNPSNATLASVAQTGHYVMTSYPRGQYEIISVSDTIIIAKSNRPYKEYFDDGPMIGITLDEFEKYFWDHVTIMHNNLNMDFKYEITKDEVIQTISYKK